MKKKIGELLFQIIPVMIGVYLGFVVSDCAGNQQKRKQSELLTQNLLSEVEMNETKLKYVVEYHEMLRDSSRIFASADNGAARPRFFKGTRIMKLNSSAYDTGIQTGVINELSIDKIQALNNLYTLQGDYNEFSVIMMSSLINKDFSDREEDMKKIARFLSITMTDIVIKENDLLQGYEDIKQILKDKDK